MRPIKFRGKRLDNGEWMEGGVDQNLNQGTVYIIDYESGYSLEVDPKTFGQLIIPADHKDNHTGFDFYEGDIVDEFGVLRELRFEICDDTQGFDVNLDFWQCKVVGNIHDNPELLNNKSK